MDKAPTEEQNKVSIITKHQFYFETPLYTPLLVKNIEKNIFEGDVDGYSALNKIETTYEISSDQVSPYVSNVFYNYYKVILTCKRKDNDILIFFILNDNGILIKVGQQPSLADIQFSKIGKEYDKVLSKEDLFEFKRAIGLAANGVGVGSLIYLRRIFENLIYKTYALYQHGIGISENDFKHMQMNEKILAMKDFLPEQLIEMKGIYSILSNGVHEFSEDQCLRYFPALKLSIELILDAQIEMKKKESKDKKVKDAISQITQELKNN